MLRPMPPLISLGRMIHLAGRVSLRLRILQAGSESCSPRGTGIRRDDISCRCAGRIQFLGFLAHATLKPAANRVQRGLPKLQPPLKQLPPPLALRILRIRYLEPALAVASMLQLGHDSFQVLFAGQAKELQAVALDVAGIE
jgi:hypothetical protein